MATHNVSTWAELVSAIGSAASGDTIKLTKDIDCNDEIPEGVASTITRGSTSLTIDGSYVEEEVTKYRIIRNLRTSVTSPVAIFSVGSTTVTFQYIDFINLVLDNYLITLGTHTGRLNFNRCRFVGRRTTYMIFRQNISDPAWTNYVTFTSCYLNIPYKGTDQTYIPIVNKAPSSNGYTTANFCWIRETFGDWTPTSGSVMSATHDMRLNGCYIDGTVVGYDDIRFTDRYSFNSPIQNVFDVDLRVIAGGDVGSEINVRTAKGVYKNLIRKLDDDSVVYTDANQLPVTTAISATPTQMQNAQWLSDNGFDIVIPNQGG